jgi:RND family efflux transporter MFP subunit
VGRIVLTLLAGVTAVNLAVAAPLPCLIEPEEVVELGSPVIGVLESISVERGDQVEKKQIVAQLMDTVEARAMELASSRAEDEAELQSAIAASEHAKREKRRLLSMLKKKLISRQVVDKAITEASLAFHKLEQARANLRNSKLELKLAIAQLNQRALRSPIEGVVTDRYLSPGQRVQDQPILKIVRIDPLRVEVIVPAEHYNRFSLGQKVNITPQLAGFDSEEAEITIIDRMIDPGSNTFRVTLRLPNPDHAIPAGARCKADLGV